jgi:hypothetical protein
VTTGAQCRELRERLAALAVRMPDQRSLVDQLRDLIPLANRAGMYDAADYIRDVVESHEPKNEGSFRPR